MYRYGIHSPEFTVNFTVGPEVYHVIIKLAETRRNVSPADRAVTIDINGVKVVANMDIAATAGGFDRAVDLTFNDIKPENGIIAIRLRNQGKSEAIAQAIEIGPGKVANGAKPKTVD